MENETPVRALRFHSNVLVLKAGGPQRLPEPLSDFDEMCRDCFANRVQSCFRRSAPRGPRIPIRHIIVQERKFEAGIPPFCRTIGMNMRRTVLAPRSHDDLHLSDDNDRHTHKPNVIGYQAGADRYWYRFAEALSLPEADREVVMFHRSSPRPGLQSPERDGAGTNQDAEKAITKKVEEVRNAGRKPIRLPIERGDGLPPMRLPPRLGCTAYGKRRVSKRGSVRWMKVRPVRYR
jgi:hypothetical protein